VAGCALAVGWGGTGVQLVRGGCALGGPRGLRGSFGSRALWREVEGRSAFLACGRVGALRGGRGRLGGVCRDSVYSVGVPRGGVLERGGMVRERGGLV